MTKSWFTADDELAFETDSIAELFEDSSIARQPTGRSDRGYVRWVQGALNRSLGLRLALDGIIGAQTRSAIRRFQQREQLPTSGVVDARTEAALARQAGLPPAIGATQGGPRAFAVANAMILRANLVRIAHQEWQYWGQGRYREWSRTMRPRLQEYWRDGVQRNYSDSQLADPGFQNNHPWSAAFISWVVRKAGGGTAFRYAAAHATYVYDAIQNRLRNNSIPVKAYRIQELAPKVGDLICNSRAGSGATYDSVRPGMKTHCDIVVDVQPGYLLAIGGNTSDSSSGARGNTVGRKRIRLDANGKLTGPRYFAVIRFG